MQHTHKVATFSSLSYKRLLFGGLFALLTTFALQAQTTRYVKATAAGSGDGSSWANASANLQAMINASAVNDQVWVAAGTYKPTNKPYNNGVEITTTDNRDKTFYVKDGVKIYGGFSASTPESTLAARNINTNVTTLSGDFNGNDVVTGSGATLSITGNTENAYHVVLASAASSGGIGVTIDGFTITGGNAYVSSSSTITVNGNSISRGSGGGIYTRNGTNTLSNNTLSGNAASGSGGGIYTSAGTNTLSDNTLSGNIAAGGGGITTSSGTNNTISNNTLSGNKATIGGGGGISATSGTNNTISNNTLSGNSATTSGGGIYTSAGTNTLSNNTLSGNSAASYGGGIYTLNGTNTLRNNIFWGNKKGTDATVASADYAAGGTNGNTFKNNLLQLVASNYPVSATGTYAIGTGATDNLFEQDPWFVDAAANNFQLSGCSPAIDAGTTTGTPPLDILGNSIYNGLKDMGVYERQTPRFPLPTAYNVTGTASYCTNSNVAVGLSNSQTGVSYQLKSGATNVGTPVSGTGSSITFGNQTAGTYTVLATNADGCTKPMTGNAVITILCCPSGNTIHVNASVSGGIGDGTSWANAYASLSDALAKAHTCSNISTIKVAAGTYKPTKKPFNAGVEMTTTDSRDLTFHIRDGITIEGGYNATTDSRDITANVTTLSGDFNGNDVVTGSGATLSITGNDENAYHVVLASAAVSGGVGVTIDGFTIKGGNAYTNTGSSITVNGNNIDRENGGGIYTSAGTNTISNNTLSGNKAGSGGGSGIHTKFGTNTISNNTLSGNLAFLGGGIHTQSGTNTISNNTFSGNYAASGGGICTEYSNNTISNNTLSGNRGASGGGILTRGGTNTLSNNTLSGNSVNFYGGGICTDQSSNNTLSNNTLSGNSAASGGGGIYTLNSTNTLSNNTLSGNSATSNGGGIFTSGGTNTLSNNIFWGNQKGTNATVASADYYADGTNGNTFKKNLLQLAASNYTTTGSGNYDLGTGATGNFFGSDPLFVNAADIDGADNIHRTADDGLALQTGSLCIDAGITGVGIPTLDITGGTRMGNPDLGAYEYGALACTAPSITTAASSNSPICTGAALNLSVAASGTAPLTYAWSGTGTFTNGTSAMPSVTGAATGNYVVTVSNSCGTVTSTAAVVVNAAVTSSVTIVADQSNPITTGSNVAFIATPTNGGTTPTYQWKKNDNNVGMNQVTYTDATLANNDVVKCEMTSNAVCPSPTIATSNDITISTCNCSPTCSDIPTAEGTYDGAISYTDAGTGLTHYCNNKGKLLLSVKPVTVGATINILPTAVHIKIGATPATLYTQWCGELPTSANRCFMASATGNGLINRWWHIDDPTSPALTLSNRLEIGFYFKEAEYNALNTLLSNVMSANTALMLYQPRQSVSLAQYAAPSLILSSKVHLLANTAANSSGTATWKIMPLTNGTIQAIFQTSTTKNSGGIGKF